MPRIPDPVKAKDPVRATGFNDLIALARRVQLAVTDPLRLILGTSQAKLVYDGPVEFWAKITEVGSGGSTGKFGWVAETPRVGGTWLDLRRHGTLADYPAYEVNGAGTAHVGDKVWMRIGPGTTDPLFQHENCS